MRTVSSELETVLESASYDVHMRVEVEDDTGTMVDLTDLSGYDWVVAASWGQNVNEIVPSATVELSREQADGDSLAPLDEDSPLYGTGPTIDGGRDIDIFVACVASGTTPTSGDYLTVFTGNIDEVSWASGTMQIYARDKLGKEAADRWIESPTEYGTEAGRALTDVMQDICDDWAPSITINVVDTPTFLVTSYEQQQMSVLEALRALAALVGYDIRPQYDSGSGVYELSLIEPDRAATTSVWTFGASDYFDVRRLVLNIEDVRNLVSVRYTSSATGARAQETATDSASVTRFGRRWMELDLAFDSPIDTSGEAQTLATAAVNDLSVPDVEQEIDVLTFPVVEIGDLHTYTANGIHYSVDQQYAVYGYRHELRRNRTRTTIQARGKPAGQYANWLGYASRVPNALDRERQRSILGFKQIRDVTAGANGEDTFIWELGELVAEVQIWEATVTSPETLDDYPEDDGSPDTTILAAATQEYTTAIPTTASGNVKVLLFVPHDIYGLPGPAITARVERVAIDGADIVDGTIVAEALIASSQRFGTVPANLFQTNGSQILWTAGTLYLADGTTYSIASGTDATPAIRPSVTYYYFNEDTSTTVVQETSSFATLNSDEKNLLLAVGWRTNTGSGASVIPSVGILALDGENITPASIQTDRIAANAITAAKIDVASLDAISADIGTITTGNISGTNVEMDFDATGTDPVIIAGNAFRVNASGLIYAANDLLFVDNTTSLPARGVIGFSGVSDFAVDDQVGSRMVTVAGGSGGATAGVTMNFSNMGGAGTARFQDAGTTGATEDCWVEVDIGGTTYYLRGFTTK